MKRIFLLTVFLFSSAAADLYELRTYTAAPGKMDALLTRFRDHTTELFEAHGIKNIGYWLTEEKDGEAPKLVYLVAHKDAETAKASWEAFVKDPKWKKAAKASRVNGGLVKKIESQYLSSTDFSKLK